MTRLRAELVCESSLHRVALSLGLGKYMRLGKGEERTGGRERPSILADMVEAIIAAMYLDGGLESAKAFILDRVLKDAEITEEHRSADYKTILQEIVQREKNQILRYVLLEEHGPDHDKTFTVEVLRNGEPLGRGTGHSKKAAEQAAAREAIRALSPDAAK